MDDFTPHYDANGVFLGVSLHGTTYVNHPIADLWLDRARMHEALVKITDDKDMVLPFSFATNILAGMSFQDAMAIEHADRAEWEAQDGSVFDARRKLRLEMSMWAAIGSDEKLIATAKKLRETKQ